MSQSSPDSEGSLKDFSSPSSADTYETLRSPASGESYQTANSGSSQSYQSVDSGSGSTGGSSTTIDANLISIYHMPTNSFTLQCFVQRSKKTSNLITLRAPFNWQLTYDFKKTVWYSHLRNTRFLSDTASTSQQQQFFVRTGECGYHLYLTKNGVLSVIYCYKDGNGLKGDIPVPINEIIPKMRAKKLHTRVGEIEVLVVGRKAQIDSNGESSGSSIPSYDHPIRANLKHLPTKSFCIYVEGGARLILLDQHRAVTNVKHHNHTLVTGGGFLLFEGELFMAFPSFGFGMYSAKQLENQQVFGANQISGKRNPVLFLQRIESKHNSLCWGLVITKYGEICLIIPDNGEFFVEDYDAKGIYDVLHRHANSKPWAHTITYDDYHSYK